MSPQPWTPVPHIPSSPGLSGHNLGGKNLHGGDTPCPIPHSSVCRSHAVSSPSGLPNACPCCHHPRALWKPAGAVPQLDAVPGANGRGQPVAALRAGWKLFQQQQGMLSLCRGSALPSLSPSSHQCHAGCHSCHPCPAPGASCRQEKCSCRGNWGLRSGSGSAEHTENSSKVFPSQSLTAVPPGCVADRACGVILTCLSLLLLCLGHRGAGTWGAPTAHPCPHALAPQQRWGCSCSPQIHSLDNWGIPIPILGATLNHRYQWENLYIYPFQTLSPPALWPPLTPSSASLQWESIKK